MIDAANDATLGQLFGGLLDPTECLGTTFFTVCSLPPPIAIDRKPQFAKRSLPI